MSDCSDYPKSYCPVRTGLRSWATSIGSLSARLAAVVFLSACTTAIPPQQAVDQYVAQKMDEYRLQSSGGISINEANTSFIGTKRRDNRIELRAVCIYVPELSSRTNTETRFLEKCEERMLEAIRRLGQANKESPYVVAGATSIAWNSNLVVLADGI